MTIYFLVDKQTYSRRLAYVIRIIGRRLGYSYSMTTDPVRIPPGSITITYLAAGELNKYSDFQPITVFNSGKIYSLETAEKTVDLLEYENKSIPLLGGKPDPGDLEQWKTLDKTSYQHKKSAGCWFVPFDLFLNIFYHLSRFEEKWRHFVDETITDHSSSLLSRYDDLKLPFVDILILYLDKLIRLKIDQEKFACVRIANWPGGEDFGVALTHDVDITREVNFPERFLKKAEDIFYRFLGQKDNRQKITAEIREKDSRAWNFPALISLYAKRNWHATFFFLAKRMEGRHFRYNIRSKKFRSLFKELIEHGHEIALHPSKFAFEKVKSYRDEKSKLEAASGVKILGMRQHYLRAKFPRLWILAEKAGLMYDASLGYNFQTGFRAGTTFPFQTYDYSEEKLLSLTEFSLHIFEYNLPLSGWEADAPQATIKKVISQVASQGGLLTVLLHPSNFRREPFRFLWDFLLAELFPYNIYVASLSEHIQWRRLRDRIKLSLESPVRTEQQLTIILPESVRVLTIEVFGGRVLSKSADIGVEALGQGLYRLKTEKQKISLTLVQDEKD